MKKKIPLSKAHRLVNHGPVVLVTSQVKGSRPNIIAVAWITPLCLNPPRVGISISENHYSHKLILEGGEFVVNVPSAAMASKVLLCGKISGKEADKFKKAHLTPLASKAVSPPLILECIGHLECRLENHIKVGDHTFFIGRIVNAWAEGDLFVDTWMVEKSGGEGLHHLGGDAFAVSNKKLSVDG